MNVLMQAIERISGLSSSESSEAISMRSHCDNADEPTLRSSCNGADESLSQDNRKRNGSNDVPMKTEDNGDTEHLFFYFPNIHDDYTNSKYCLFVEGSVCDNRKRKRQKHSRSKQTPTTDLAKSPQHVSDENNTAKNEEKSEGPMECHPISFNESEDEGGIFDDAEEEFGNVENLHSMMNDSGCEVLFGKSFAFLQTEDENGTFDEGGIFDDAEENPSGLVCPNEVPNGNVDKVVCMPRTLFNCTQSADMNKDEAGSVIQDPQDFDLPTEIIGHILEYTDIHSRTMFALSSKRLYRETLEGCFWIWFFSQNPADPIVVDTLCEQDIVTGIKGPFTRSRDFNFRQLIASRRGKYDNSSRRQKTEIINRLVNSIVRGDGRFLTKGLRSNCHNLLTEKQARGFVSRLLRKKDGSKC